MTTGLSIIFFIQFFLISSLLYRLVTTNHWTMGKKILVGLIGSLGLKHLVWWIPCMGMNPVIIVMLAELPLSLILLLTAYLFYMTKD